MRIHADLRRRALVDPSALPWRPSPLPGVERRMLERDGDEVARATSLVRYAPGSRFDAHEHGLGEEFVVLEGVFSDESGDFGPGWYVRNPPGSAHTPHSEPGCVLFVKLRQMDPADGATVRIDTNAGAWEPGRAEGVEVLPLHAHGSESVRIVRFAPGARVPHHVHEGGEEILVLEGSFEDEAGVYRTGTWVRNPDGSAHAVRSAEGCRLWVKSGHLPRVE